MGQEQSSVEEKNTVLDGSSIHKSSTDLRRPVSFKDKSYFMPDESLENVGDIESILEALNIDSTPSEDSEDISPNIIEMHTLKKRKKTIDSVVHARSHKFIRNISEMYPEVADDPLSRIRVSTMVEVVQYCNSSDRISLSLVSKYFHMLTQTSRVSADINCRIPWVDSVNMSPFIESIELGNVSSDSEMDRFCRIIDNDGFLHLKCIYLVLMTEDNIVAILEAIGRKASRIDRLGMFQPSEAISLSLYCYFFTSRICYAFAEAAANGLNKVLGSLCLHSNDLEGIANFFKITDFKDFLVLQNIKLHSCPLQSRGFELFVRSIWPIGHSAASLAPIHSLILDNTQLRDCSLLSMQNAMERGLLVNLETLNLSCNSITQVGIVYITDALSQYSCPNLKSLFLTDNFLMNGSIVDLMTALTQGVCPMISQIEISNTGIGADDLRAFALFIQSPFSDNLSRINISNNPMITQALSLFFESLLLSSCMHIKTLFMEGISVSTTEIRILAKWLVSGKSMALRNLLLRSNILDQEAFHLLLKALIHKNCPKLSVIDFGGNIIGNFDEELWSDLFTIDGTTIDFEQIDYSFNPLTDKDMAILLRFMHQFSHIERTSRITFSNNSITLRTIESYFNAMPKQACALNYINIESCSITGSGQYFYQFICSDAARNLDELSLRDCSLSTLDLFTLCDALDNGVTVKLRCLALEGNGELNDLFMTRFLKTIDKGNVPNLSSIRFGYTELTMIGIQELLNYIRINPFTHLQDIDVTSINVTKEYRKSTKATFKEEFCGEFHI